MDQSAQGGVRHLLTYRAEHPVQPKTEKLPRLCLIKRFDDRSDFYSPNQITQLGVIEKGPELGPPDEDDLLMLNAQRVETGYDLQVSEHVGLQALGVVKHQDELISVVIQSESIK
jgi:hypothetical protein